MKRSILPTLAILIFGSIPLAAETEYRFEVFGAGTLPMDKDFELTEPQVSPPMSGRQEFSLGGRGGVRLGAEGAGHWGQDFIYSYGTNATRIVNEATGAQFAFTPRVHQASYNALWYPGGTHPRKTVFPYLTAGVGAAFFVLSERTINEALDTSRAGLGKLRSENVFSVNAGGGVRFRFNSLYGLRLDVRDYMSRPVRYGLPKRSDDPSATVFPLSGVLHQVEFSFGFVYYF
jgi:hypothetical protein